MDRVEDTAQNELQEIGLQLLDRCRAEVARHPQSKGREASELEASAISLAVQTVVMADAMTQRGHDGMVSLDSDRGRGMFVGLGMGAGHVLGANGEPKSIELAMASYAAGLMATLPSRLRSSMESFAKTPWAKKP